MRYFITSLRRILVCCLIVALLSATVSHTVFAAGETVDISQEATNTNAGKVKTLASGLRNANPSATNGGYFTWDTERKPRSWTYYNGIMMDAYLMLDSEAYMDYVEAFYNVNIGTSRVYKDDQDCGYVSNQGASDNYYRRNELDSIPPTRALFDLIRANSSNKNKYINELEYVYTLMQEQTWPVPGTDGNFIHKRQNNSWSKFQVALDGLYMAQPFFMELAKAKEDGLLETNNVLKNINPNAIYKDVHDRMLWVGNNLYDEQTGLYNHAWGPNGAGVNGHFWLRAIGWYAAALADVISMMPEGQYRNDLIQVAKKLFDGMIPYQQSSGMWYNVVNKNDTLVGGNGNSNKLESSGSALMAYAMMRLYVEGHVGDTYGEAGLKAFNGTVDSKLVSGRLTDVYISSGVCESDADYLKNSYVTNEAKGVGPLMMAASYAGAAADKYNTVTDPDYTPPVAKSGLTYNGSDQPLVTAGTTNDGIIEYALGSDGNTAPQEGWTQGIPSGKDAGTYYVWYRLKGDSRHNDADPQPIAVTIAPKAITVTGITAKDKVYDGTTTAALDTSNPVLVEIVPGDNLTVTAAGLFNDANAANDKTVSIFELFLGGQDKDNYVLATVGQQKTATASITKKPATVTAVDQTVDLNGSIETDVSKAALTGALAGHTLREVTLTASSTANATSDGTITPSAAKIKNGDEDVTDNYEITYTPGTLTVNKGASSVAEDPVGKENLVYTASAQELVDPGQAENGTLLYALGTAEEPTGEFTESIPEAVNAGTYHVWYKVAGDANHTDTEPRSVIVNIARKAATITAKDQTIEENASIAEGPDQVNTDGILGSHVLAEISLSPGTGSQKDKIIPADALIKDGNENDVTGNYDVTYIPGSLTVRQQDPDPVDPSENPGDLASDESISVSGLETGDKVSFYQILKFSEDAAETGGWVAAEGFTSLTVDDIQKILGLGDYAPGKEKADQAGIDEVLAARIADMAEAATAAYPDIEEVNKTAKKENPSAGLYVALITPRQTKVVYNPVFVAADFDRDNNTNAWTVNLNDSYQPASMAKKAELTLTKTASTADGNPDGVSAGDNVSFTVTTTIPEYGDNYTRAVFGIIDRLSTGLELQPGTIKVYKDAVAAENLLAGGEEYAPATASSPGTAYKLTVNTEGNDSFTVRFFTQYILGLSSAQNIIVTYDATVTTQAPSSVNLETNTAAVNYSNGPTDEEGKGTLADQTKHYTFDIDGNLLGENTWKTTEVVKVGLDSSGKEISEVVELHEGQSVGALEGATFKLYVPDEEGTHTVKDAEGNTIRTKPYTNSILTAGKVIVSDSTGRLTIQGESLPGIRGLDLGTYYLVEESAPAGYIKSDTAVKLEILAPDDAEHWETKTYEETRDEYSYSWDVKELKKYEVKINGQTTATYTFTNSADTPGTLADTSDKATKGDNITGNESEGLIGWEGATNRAGIGKIINTQGAKLPSTGGPGTGLIYLIGLMLTGFAGAGLVMRRKKGI